MIEIHQLPHLFYNHIINNFYKLWDLLIYKLYLDFHEYVKVLIQEIIFLYHLLLILTQ